MVRTLAADGVATASLEPRADSALEAATDLAFSFGSHEVRRLWQCESLTAARSVCLAFEPSNMLRHAA